VTAVGMTPTTWPRFATALAIAVVVPLVLGGLGILNDYRSGLLAIGAITAVAGLALNVLLGYAGQLSLGHYALVGFGAFMAAKFTDPVELGLPFAVGAVLAPLCTGALGFVVGLPALRLKGLYLAVVTIGFHFAMDQGFFQSAPLSKGSGGTPLPRPWIGTFELSSGAHYLALLCGIVVIVWWVDSNLTASKLGRAFQGIRADEDVAASFGIDVARYKLTAFTLSGVYAGLAGVMLGHQIGVVNFQTFPFEKSLLLVIVVVVGGVGSRVGIVTAAAFFGVLPVLFESLVNTSVVSSLIEDLPGPLSNAADPQGWDLILGAALLLFTVARNPGGLAEGVRHAREDREQRQLKRSIAARRDEETAGDADDESPEMPALPDLPRPSGLPERRHTTGPVLEVRDLSISFGGLRAVDNASLSVPPNRIVGLIGPNGAGKTTVFNLVTGVLVPDHGSVHLLGEDVTGLAAHVRARRGLGRTFQNIGLARDISVRENLLLAQHQVASYADGWGLIGLGPAPAVESELGTRADEALGALGFERFADTPVRNLSGGQQRIVEIAAALVTAPELVMLDEPSAGMAPALVENLAERLSDLRDDLGRTVLLIEHNIPLVMDVCDELYVMDAGAVLAHGTPADVISEPAVVTAYLGEPAL